MNKAHKPGLLARPGSPHSGQLNNAAFVPLGAQTRIFLIAFFLMSLVISPALSYTLNGGDDPYPLATFGLNLAYAVLLVAPLALPTRVGLLHPLVFPLIFGTVKSLIKDPLFIISPFDFLFEGYQTIRLHQALTHYGTAQLAAVQLKVTLLNILGLLSYYGGYLFFRAKVARRRLKSYRMVQIPLFAVIMLTAVGAWYFINTRGGISEHMANLAFGRFQALGAVGYLIAVFDIATVAAFLWLALRPSALRSPWFLLALPPVALMQFALTGSRASIFVFLLGIGVLWLMNKRKLSVRVVVAVALLMPLGLASIGVLGAIRTSGLSGTGSAEFTALTSFDLKDSIAHGQEEIAKRRMVDGPMGVVAEGMHTTGPLLGKTYVGGVLFWVPRAVWPGKPRGVGAYYVSQILSPGAEFSVPVGPVAEAYWNFGFAGVVLVLGLWGAFHRWLGDYYAVNGDNPFFRVFYFITLSTASPSSDSLAPYMQQCGLLLALFVLLRICNSRAAPAAAHRAAPVAAVRRL